MIHLSTILRADMADAIGTMLGGGSVEIRTGAPPASANVAATGDLLVTLSIPDPAGVVSGGTLTMDPIPEAVAIASGTATWARVKGPTGTAFDCDVGATMTLSTTAVTTGTPVKITSFTITIPAG